MRTLVSLLPALACAAMMLPMLRSGHTADTAGEKATNDELVALRGELAHLRQAPADSPDIEARKGHHRATGRGWVAAAVVGLGLLLAACGNTEEGSNTGTQSGQPVVAVGDKAPPFSLPSGSGENVSLADYRGQKPVLLYFSMGPG